ncbi:hypothetical protein GCM10017687_44710 [Streptomyces echinatus]|uniref:Uncharacterized protein n=1 Tax=Streptomyces echinatus TaxID=67293 RepID=A0A7W9Q1V6_9ACTN|nr:hypothetical protein [Streptomyces echinatus]
MSRARVGTVVIEMHYGPLRDEAGSESQAEQLMRIVCDGARAPLRGSSGLRAGLAGSGASSLPFALTAGP